MLDKQLFQNVPSTPDHLTSNYSHLSQEKQYSGRLKDLPQKADWVHSKPKGRTSSKFTLKTLIIAFKRGRGVKVVKFQKERHRNTQRKTEDREMCYVRDTLIPAAYFPQTLQSVFRFCAWGSQPGYSLFTVWSGGMCVLGSVLSAPYFSPLIPLPVPFLNSPLACWASFQNVTMSCFLCKWSIPSVSLRYVSIFEAWLQMTLSSHTSHFS